jgi:hypothetical protein
VFGKIFAFRNVAVHIAREVEVKVGEACLEREPIPEPMPPGIIGKYDFVAFLFSGISHIEYDPRSNHIHFLLIFSNF